MPLDIMFVGIYVGTLLKIPLQTADLHSVKEIWMTKRKNNRK